MALRTAERENVARAMRYMVGEMRKLRVLRRCPPHLALCWLAYAQCARYAKLSFAVVSLSAFPPPAPPCIGSSVRLGAQEAHTCPKNGPRRAT